MKDVRVRYAPSPTGHLHIGGARAALFNYMFAKKYNGKFIIRIEDTDVDRNIESGENSQLDYLKWLGIAWDESVDVGGEFGPYRQLERLDIYKKYANELLDKGLAYKCFCTKEELEAEREALMTSGSDKLHYSGRCSHLTAEQILAFEGEGRPYTIRLKVTLNEEYSFDDIVKGTVTFNSNDIGDWVIVKQNGIPTYNFAVVIDDYLMKISHVLRGEDHLTNTGKQIGLYKAFGWDLPIFGHTTLIVNDQGKKLSKRDESILQFVEQYKDLGYLPEAMFNFIALLGWSPTGEEEILPPEKLVESFSEERLSKSPARFDKDKLTYINNRYMKQLSLNEAVTLCTPFLDKSGITTKKTPDWTSKVVSLFQKRLSFASEIVDMYTEHFTFNGTTHEGLQFINDAETKPTIEFFLNSLRGLGTFDCDSISPLVKLAGKETGVKGKNLFMSLRIASTFKEHGPDLPKVLDILGKEQVISNLEDTLSKI